MLCHGSCELCFYNDEEDIIYNFQSSLRENPGDENELVLGSCLSSNFEFI